MSASSTSRLAELTRPSAQAGLAPGAIVPRSFIPLVVVLLSAGAGFVLWKTCLEGMFVPKRWGVVEEACIYRSGQLSPQLVKPMLQKHHIQVVIDLTAEEPHSGEQRAERAAVAELGITQERCPLIGDGTGDVAQYTAALRALVIARRSGRPVVVHCSAGAQRTGGVIAAYRLLFEHASPESVLSEMQRYGWRPERDKVLREYLNAHLPEMAEQLKHEGFLAQVPEPLPRL